MLLAQHGTTFVVVFVAVALGLFILWSFIRYASVWLTAHLTGVPIPFPEIIGMVFRRVDPKAIVSALVVAKQAGQVLSRAELERAYLRGADINKITLAFVRAKAENLDVTFEDLVQADLGERSGGSRPN